jgi:predicted dehydrogenase
VSLTKKFPKKFAIVNDYQILLENKQIRNFIFATPPSQNFKLVSKALKYKKKIFLEKPGFKNYNEIKKISNKYPKEIKNIFFGYIYMFNNHIRYIKKFIENKNNGKIIYIKCQRQNLGPIRNDVDVNYDLSTHDLSILLYFFGNKIKIINNLKHNILKKKIADISSLCLKINNFFVDINNSWLNPDKIRRLTIITNKKMLLFDEMKPYNKIKIFNKYAEYPKISRLANKNFFKNAKIYEGNSTIPKIKENDPLYDELNFFLKSNLKNNFLDYKLATKILKLI